MAVVVVVDTGLLLIRLCEDLVALTLFGCVCVEAVRDRTFVLVCLCLLLVDSLLVRAFFQISSSALFKFNTLKQGSYVTVSKSSSNVRHTYA